MTGAARRARLSMLLVIVSLCVLGLMSLRAQPSTPIYQITLDNGVTPPAVAFAQRALQEAVSADASAFVVQISNGGSVVGASWSLARALHDAPIPVVVWVGPGAIDGGPSATLLLAASDVAVMAPGARTGFAYPLASAPAGFGDQTRQLLLDDVVREVTAWQNERGRNQDWIERAVRSGAVIDAERARSLDPPLIDLIAATPEDLLLGLTGRQIVDPAGQQRTLDTLGAATVAVPPTTLETLLQLLAVPTIAFILFVVGAIVIALEMATPGVGVPGVAGIVVILAALYGFVQADVRPLAVIVLVGAVALMSLEYVVMSHGALSVAGIILLVGGALWLVDPATTPGFGVAPLAIVGMSVVTGGAVVGLITLALRVRSRAPVTGAESMIGQIAEVRRAIDPEGMVYVHGALWSAWSDEAPIDKGELVEIADIENLRLYVRRVTEPSSPGDGR